MQADKGISTEASEIAAAVAADQAIAKADGKDKPKVPGRKARTSDHQEAVIKLDELNPLAVEMLITDLKAAQEAATIFDEGIKANAERAGIQSSVLRRFITARAGEKFEDKKRDAMQLSLLFEEIGE
jgi:predicted Zn-dependent protease